MKVFYKLPLKMMESVFDGYLRDEQTGFRRGCGCNGHTFVTRHLMQQVNEMKMPFSLCFIDFEKAFNSAYRKAMRKIMR